MGDEHKEEMKGSEELAQQIVEKLSVDPAFDDIEIKRVGTIIMFTVKDPLPEEKES